MLGEALHSPVLHLPCSKTNYLKALLTNNPSYPEEERVKNRWRGMENQSKTQMLNLGAGATSRVMPQVQWKQAGGARPAWYPAAGAAWACLLLPS